MIIKENMKPSKDFNALDKAIRIYVRNISKSSRFEFDSEKISYLSFFENKLLLVHAIRYGLPYQLFIKIKELTPFSEDDWVEYLSISKKTLQRYSSDENHLFKSIHTEKIIEIAEVTILGNEVFDSTEQFYLWLITPSHALGNLKPLELLKDSYGKEMVMAELNRIEHVIFA
jgi:putative toxin-antitoxin system antitoxin component (TIGR02293 family)